VGRWLAIRFILLSNCIIGLAGFALLKAGSHVDAAIAGFVLTFALNIWKGTSSFNQKSSFL
jgi:hypothetical protein